MGAWFDRIEHGSYRYANLVFVTKLVRMLWTNMKKIKQSV